MLHRFPNKTDPRYAQWLTATGRKDPKIGPTTCICSQHFSSNDYHISPVDLHNPRLNRDAIPSIGLEPSQLKTASLEMAMQSTKSLKKALVQRKLRIKIRTETTPKPCAKTVQLDHSYHTDEDDKRQPKYRSARESALLRKIRRLQKVIRRNNQDKEKLSQLIATLKQGNSVTVKKPASGFDDVNFLRTLKTVCNINSLEIY